MKTSQHINTHTHTHKSTNTPMVVHLVKRGVDTKDKVLEANGAMQAGIKMGAFFFTVNVNFVNRGQKPHNNIHINSIIQFYGASVNNSKTQYPAS